jgi:hypothetical protein
VCNQHLSRWGQMSIPCSPGRGPGTPWPNHHVTGAAHRDREHHSDTMSTSPLTMRPECLIRMLPRNNAHTLTANDRNTARAL